MLEVPNILFKVLFCPPKFSIFKMDRLARQPHTIVGSIKIGLGIDHLLAKIWEYLDFIRVRLYAADFLIWVLMLDPPIVRSLRKREEKNQASTSL